MTASLIGYIIGFGFAMIAGATQNGFKQWSLVPASAVLQAFVVCLLVGGLLTVLATIVPAIRASKLPPAAALRVEV